MLEAVKAELKRKGVEFATPPGEYTVRDLCGGEPEAFELLDDALERARAIAASRPWTPPVAGARRRGKRIFLMPPKARARAFRRAVNLKMARARWRQSGKMV